MLAVVQTTLKTCTHTKARSKTTTTVTLTLSLLLAGALQTAQAADLSLSYFMGPKHPMNAAVFTPFAEKLIAKLKDLIDRFRNLSTEQKESIIRFAAILATAGPLLIVIGKMSLGIVAVANAVSLTTKA